MSSFSEIKPTLQKHCTSCHNENWPDKNWLDEKTVLKNKDKIIQRLENKSMPPGNSTNMTDAERKKIINWLKDKK
jgi:uncharacterized membrane protein